MKTLAQLVAEQRAAGLTPCPDCGQSHVGTCPEPTRPETPKVAAVPVVVVSAAPSGGYCRVLPPSAPTIASLSESWKAEHWSKPSPWCHVDGQPDHPDFVVKRFDL